jgi:hypothetical protein
MTQANDLPSRLNRAEANIIDLRLAASALLQAIDKNSTDIADLIEVTRGNSEAIACNSESISRLSNEMMGIREREPLHSKRPNWRREQQFRTFAVRSFPSMPRLSGWIDCLIT